MSLLLSQLGQWGRPLRFVWHNLKMTKTVEEDGHYFISLFVHGTVYHLNNYKRNNILFWDGNWVRMSLAPEGRRYSLQRQHFISAAQHVKMSKRYQVSSASYPDASHLVSLVNVQRLEPHMSSQLNNDVDRFTMLLYQRSAQGLKAHDTMSISDKLCPRADRDKVHYHQV